MFDTDYLFTIVMGCILQYEIKDIVEKIPELINPSFLSELYSQAYDKGHSAGVAEVENCFKGLIYDYIELRKKIKENTYMLIDIYDDITPFYGYKIVEIDDPNYPIGFTWGADGIGFKDIRRVV